MNGMEILVPACSSTVPASLVEGCSAAGLSSIEAGAPQRILSNVGAPRVQAKFLCCSDRFVRYVLRDRHLDLKLAVGDVSFIDGIA